MSYLDALAVLLERGGFGTRAQDLFVGLAPDDSVTVDAVTSLIGRAGPVEETFDQKRGRPNVQLYHRGNPRRSAAAEAKIWAMWNYLDFANMDVTYVDDDDVERTQSFTRIGPLSTPDFLTTDNASRPAFTLDLEVWLA